MPGKPRNRLNEKLPAVKGRRRSGAPGGLIEDPAFLLASAVETANDAIYTTAMDGTVTSWNCGAEGVFGFRADEILGTPVSILIPPGQDDDVAAVLDRIRRGEVVPHYETVRRRKDGRRIHVSISISPICDSAGHIVGTSRIARDITAAVEARRHSEEKLASASHYARSLLESSLDPLVTISADGKITDVNEATVKVTGVPRERLVGTDYANCFTEPERAREGYRQVFANGFVTDYPLTFRHTDGRLTDVLYNGSIYRDARGEVMGVFAAARDVTARKKAEAELAEQRQRELERLAELEKFQRLTVGRELKMVKLKKEIEELRREIEQLGRRPDQDGDRG